MGSSGVAPVREGDGFGQDVDEMTTTTTIYVVTASAITCTKAGLCRVCLRGRKGCNALAAVGSSRGSRSMGLPGRVRRVSIASGCVPGKVR